MKEQSSGLFHLCKPGPPLSEFVEFSEFTRATLHHTAASGYCRPARVSWFHAGRKRASRVRSGQGAVGTSDARPPHAVQRHRRSLAARWRVPILWRARHGPTQPQRYAGPAVGWLRRDRSRSAGKRPHRPPLSVAVHSDSPRPTRGRARLPVQRPHTTPRSRFRGTSRRESSLIARCL